VKTFRNKIKELDDSKIYMGNVTVPIKGDIYFDGIEMEQWLRNTLTTYGDQRAEEGAQQARKHYYDKVDREAREKEAYLWFNTWYERNIDPGNKQMFGKWASERLQELGCTPPNTTE